MPPEILKASLTTIQADALLKQIGPNKIAEGKKRTLFEALVGQFNILMLLLLAAAAVSFAAGEHIDGLFILVIVILNALFGIYQEYQADQSLKALQNLTISTIRVIRDGKELEIDSTQLVPGDIIYVEEGTKIPADAVVLDTKTLEVDEAALTGESLPVEKTGKKAGDQLIFMGTVVVKGHGYAKIIKTGDLTRFGAIAQTLTHIKSLPTPLQKKIGSLSKIIGVSGLIASIIVFIISFIKHKTLLQSFLFSVSLAVAAVPEGLPAVMTTTLAIGVKRMAARRAIVRRLESIEGLGATTIIATDKTGTLTQNVMQVQNVGIEGKIYHSESFPPASHFLFEKLLLNSVLCSTASLVPKAGNHQYDILGDPTEGALLVLAQEAGLNIEKTRRDWKKSDELPFNAQTKRMTVMVKNGAHSFVFSKGAPESIMDICDYEGKATHQFTDKKKQMITASMNGLAKEGYRLLAFSYKKPDKQHHEKGQIFLGFAALADEVRKEAAAAVAKAHQAGIQVVMITGDNALTAQNVGIQCGIIQKGDDILEGYQLDKYNDEELIEILPKVKIFARTTPEHKYRLVELYQKMSHVVTVTGDGVNDALALKQADVGVAMGETGTDVARETADMIITDDNFASLIAAVEEGRNIFINIKKAVKYLLSTNLAEVLVVILTMLATDSVALTALQILYINLISDGLPALSLAFTPSSTHVMRQKPISQNQLLSRRDLSFILTVGMVGSFLTLVGFKLGLEANGIETARSLAFTTIIFIQPLVLLYLWSARHSLRESIYLLKRPLFAIAFALPFLLHPLIFYSKTIREIFEIAPLPIPMILLALMLSTLILLPLEIRKIQVQVEE